VSKANVKFWQDLKFFAVGIVVLVVLPAVIYREVLHRQFYDSALNATYVLGAIFLVIGIAYLRACQAAEKFQKSLGLDAPMTRDDVVAYQGYANKMIKEKFAAVAALRKEKAEKRKPMEETTLATREEAIANRKLLRDFDKKIRKALAEARMVRSIVRRNGLKTFREVKYATF
jgi:hypothetical protein